MTQDEVRSLYAVIELAASQQGINLADPSNAFTLWMENPKGSGEYHFHGQPTSLVQAMNLAGAQDAIIRRTDIGRIQLIVARDRQWFYS